MDYKHVTSIATQQCDTLKAALLPGEGYYIDPTYNEEDGLCRSIPAASVQHVRRAHTHGGAYWLDLGDHASAQTYLPLQTSLSPTPAGEPKMSTLTSLDSFLAPSVVLFSLCVTFASYHITHTITTLLF